MIVKSKSKLLAILMSLAMAFTMMPMMGAPVYADDPAPPAICLANGAAPNIKGEQKDNIYFGHYPQSEAGSVEGLTENVDYIKVSDKNYLIEPIKWRALDFPIDSQGNLLPELVLLSDQNLDCKQYHEQNTSITWKDSNIRAWLNDGFKNTAFLSSEQEAVNLIEVVNKANPGPLTPGGENTEDWLFLLSIEEATNEKYGFTDDYNNTTTREAKNTAYAKAQGASTNSAGNGFWWLRAPGGTDHSAAFVHRDGGVGDDGYDVDYDRFGVRPAFNLNLSSVLFTSAAEGGKSSGDVGAGSLKEVGTNETKEWKLTVKDKEHKDFKVESVSTCDGKTLKIKYSDAKKGDGEYISAIITDQFSNIKYYGNLKQFVDEDSTPDTAEVTIDGKLESTDKLYIINEQLNGDKKTDFSSPLQKLEIPTAYHDLVKEDKVEPTCTTPGTEEYWKCENCTEMFADKDGKTKIAEPEEISATGHDWDQNKENIVFNYYVENGSKKCKATLTCKKDSSHKEDVISHGGVGGPRKAATCEEDGIEYYNYGFKPPYAWLVPLAEQTWPIPATGHTFDQEKAEEKYIKTAADCTRPAEYYVSCSKCDASSQGAGDKEASFKSGDPLGHDYSVELPETAKAPTCTEDGKEADIKCSRCEDVQKGKKIDKTGHLWGQWKVAKKPTALNRGEEKRVCKHDSSHVETKAIAATGVSGTALSKMKAKGKTALTISWSKIKGAEGYDIFFVRCGSTSKYKKEKAIKGNKTFSWTKTGLKKKKPYKAYVKAWVMKDGKKKYVSKSPSVHTYTTGSTKNYTPAKAVKVNKTRVSLKKGKTFKIKASIVKQNRKKKLMPTDHAPKFRYVTSNSKIATVTKSGKITAKGSGTCYIVAFAHNGVSKSIKVTVK